MDNLRGAALLTFSMLCFALEDMFVKLAAQTLPRGQILILFGLGAALVFGVAARLMGQAPVTRDMLRGPLALRSLCEGVSAIGFVMALALVPLSLMTTIVQANPLLITLGAALIFAEPVGWRRWSAVLVGLGGVMIVLRPFGEGFQPAALFAVLGVLFQAGRDLATRKVPPCTSSLQISIAGFLALIGAGIGLMLVAGERPVWPDRREWLYMLGMLGIGLPAFYSIVAAMRLGDISFIAPFRYSRIVFGLAVGLVVFDERLDRWMLIGAAVIVASGLYTLWREARLRRASLARSHAL